MNFHLRLQAGFRDVIGLAVLAFMPFQVAAQNLPTPVLTGVVSDRPAQGDIVALTGEDLGESADSVTVLFSPGVEMTPSNHTRQRVECAVPPGARSGPISVTVSRILPGGTTQKATSNSLPLLVIWRSFDWSLIPSDPGPLGDDIANTFVAGDFDSVHVFRYGRTQRIWSVGHDGSIEPQFGVSTYPWYIRFGNVTQSRTTQHVVGLASRSGCSGCENQEAVVDFTAGEVLWSCTGWGCYRGWHVVGVEFDASGNLVVAADLLGASSGRAISLWSYAPGEPLSFDPTAQNCLMPGGIPSIGGWDEIHNLAVAGNGTVYALEWGRQDPDILWRVDPDGSIHAANMPPTPGSYANAGWWYLAADCRSEAYAVNPYMADDSTGLPLTIFRLSDLSPAVTIDSGVYGAWGLGTDARGNLYVLTLVQGQGWQFKLLRITEDQITGGQYCMLPSATTAAFGRAQGGECEQCAPENAGHLRLELGDDTIDESGGMVKLPLGARPQGLALWVEPGREPQPIGVRWELSDVTSTWSEEHDLAVSLGYIPSAKESSKSVLFPDNVLLLFDEGWPTAEVPTRNLAAVHSGVVNLKISAQSTPAGGPAELETWVTVTYQGSSLGSTNNQYDETINRWANAFGVIPQVVKGVVNKESADFSPAKFRYEPDGWEYGSTLAAGGISYNLRSHPYFEPFRFAEPGGIPGVSGTGPLSQGPFLVQSDMDGRAFGPVMFTLEGVGPLPPSTCVQVSPGRGALSAWALYLGSNGDPDDPPGQLTPCGTRLNWDRFADVVAWASERPKVKPLMGNAATWWFYEYPQYNAQTFLAASYGLMQIGYPTALIGMGWNTALSDSRHWADFIPPDANVYLGSRWLAWPWKSVDVEKAIPEHFEGSFDVLMWQLLCKYNAGQKPKPSACGAYPGDALGFAAQYEPKIK